MGKTKQPKFTFKKEPRETGLMAVGRPYQDVNIKLNKMNVGLILAPIWSTKDSLWRVRFMQNRGDRQSFDWIGFGDGFATEEEARAYVNSNTDRIIALGLHSQEPDD